MGVPYQPHNYQAKAILFGIINTFCALFLDPGLGKTSITLSIFRALQRLGLVRSALIVAPLRVVYSVWPAECEKWEPFGSITLSIIHGDETKRLKALKADADLYLINPEGVVWLEKIKSGERRREVKREVKAIQEDMIVCQDDDHHAKLCKRLEKMVALMRLVIDAKLPTTLDLLVIDESTKFKTSKSSRFRSLRKLLGLFQRRMILTGTPTPKSYEDLWSQFFIVDRGDRLFPNVTEYYAKYFSQGGFKNRERFIYPGADQMIQEQIRDVTLRLDADDHLDMPELIVNDIYVDLEPKPRKIYDSMEDLLFAELAAGVNVFAQSGSSKYNACRQIANGGCYAKELFGTEDKTVHHIHEAKIDAVESLFNELNGKPLLVFYLYRHDLLRLQKRFGDTRPFIAGGVSPKRTNEIVDQWNAKEIPLLFAQPAAMSHGLNMQAAGNDMAWLGLPDDLEHYEQAYRRIYRQGVVGGVRLHRIFCRNTVEAVVKNRTDQKDTSQRGFLNSLNDYRRNK